MIYNNLDQLNQELPAKGRIIGLDVGTKKIGVAICDADRNIASPKLTILRKGNQKDFMILEKFIKENNVVAIIVGLPLNMDGSASEMSKFVRRFADNLDQFLPDLKIAFADERLSSFAAEDILNEKIPAKNNKKKMLVDQIAASIILSSALENLKS
jgi:putative Holliday junction resolvase